MSISLLIASSDDHFREMVRENLLNVPTAKVIAEDQEVTANLYIRVLQDLERNPDAALMMDLGGDTDASLKALERVKQAAPDLYVIASSSSAGSAIVIESLHPR